MIRIAGSPHVGPRALPPRPLARRTSDLRHSDTDFQYFSLWANTGSTWTAVHRPVAQYISANVFRINMDIQSFPTCLKGNQASTPS